MKPTIERQARAASECTSEKKDSFALQKNHISENSSVVSKQR
jgi:hypothetical protein